MKHSNILINLTVINVPNYAIKLIKSYLTRRSMCVRFHGAVSSFHSCPGGLLTWVLFCLQVNKAGSPCPPPQLPVLGQEETNGPATGLMTSPTPKPAFHPLGRKKLQVQPSDPFLIRKNLPDKTTQEILHRRFDHVRKKSHSLI